MWCHKKQPNHNTRHPNPMTKTESAPHTSSKRFLFFSGTDLKILPNCRLSNLPPAHYDNQRTVKTTMTNDNCYQDSWQPSIPPFVAWHFSSLVGRIDWLTMKSLRLFHVIMYWFLNAEMGALQTMHPGNCWDFTVCAPMQNQSLQNNIKKKLILIKKVQTTILQPFLESVKKKKGKL